MNTSSLGPFVVAVSLSPAEIIGMPGLVIVLGQSDCARLHAATVRAYVQPETARPNQVINYVITVQDGQVQSLPNLTFSSSNWPNLRCLDFSAGEYCQWSSVRVSPAFLGHHSH
jgi:hypothetical protein